MSHFIFGRISSNSEGVTTVVKKATKTLALSFLTNSEIPQNVVKEMLNEQLSEKPFYCVDFLVVEKETDDNSDSLISPFFIEGTTELYFARVSKLLEDMQKVFTVLSNDINIVYADIFFTEGYESNFRLLRLDLSEFKNDCLDIFKTSENYVPSIRASLTGLESHAE